MANGWRVMDADGEILSPVFHGDRNQSVMYLKVCYHGMLGRGRWGCHIARVEVREVVPKKRRAT